MGKLIATLIFKTLENHLVYFEVFENNKNQEEIDQLIKGYKLVDLIVAR